MSDTFGGAESGAERAARSGHEYLYFMENAPEYALRGFSPEDLSLPRQLSDKDNSAWHAFVLAKTINSDTPADSDSKHKLETSVARVPSFAVVRSIYHARLRRPESPKSSENPEHIRQKIGFDAFLMAQVFCDDEKLSSALPSLDSELFVPHLSEGMKLASQERTHPSIRMEKLKSMEFLPARALAFGIRSELFNNIRYAEGEIPLPQDPREWSPELKDEVIEYQEGSDTAAFMTNACLKAIQASRA